MTRPHKKKIPGNLDIAGGNPDPKPDSQRKSVEFLEKFSNQEQMFGPDQNVRTRLKIEPDLNVWPNCQGNMNFRKICIQPYCPVNRNT